MTIKLSVCIEMIFSDLPIEERISRVAQSSLKAFEFWDWQQKDLSLINERRKIHKLDVAAFLMEPKGNLVSKLDPEYVKEGVRRSVKTAKMLDCSNLIVVVGQEDPLLNRQEQHKNIVNSLKIAAPIAEDAGINLVVEPLNVKVNHRGFFLSSSYEAFEIIEEVGSPIIKVLLDIYHQQVQEGNIIATITKNIDKIGYFHVADVPGRHEPGTGEINFQNVIKAIKETGFAGYIGLEYRPSIEPCQSFQTIIEIVAAENCH